MLAAPLLPGVRRSWTGDFSELRARCLERKSGLAGPRVEQLRGIITGGDREELARFVESGRSARLGAPSAPCARCNVRIADRPGAAEAAAGVRPAKLCRICLRWHCEGCRCHAEELSSVAAGSSAVPSDGASPPRMGPDAASPSEGGAIAALRRRFSSGPAELKTCVGCHEFVEALRWRCLPVDLTLGQARLVEVYRDLAVRITSLAGSVAQLDGLARVLELPTGVTTDSAVETAALREGLAETLEEQRCAVAAAVEGLRTAVRAAQAVECPPPPHCDGRLRNALARHGRLVLERLRLQAAAAEQRSLAAPGPRGGGTARGPDPAASGAA